MTLDILRGNKNEIIFFSSYVAMIGYEKQKPLQPSFSSCVFPYLI